MGQNGALPVDEGLDVLEVIHDVGPNNLGLLLVNILPDIVLRIETLLILGKKAAATLQVLNP
jgi:hypothetical protein